MARISFLSVPDNTHLDPGKTIWKTVGPSPEFANSAISVTAVAGTGQGGAVPGNTYVMKVDDINTTMIQTPGDVGEARDNYIGFNVTNNGKASITGWTVYIGLITP
jgi:hypothetical protein